MRYTYTDHMVEEIQEIINRINSLSINVLSSLIIESFRRLLHPIFCIIATEKWWATGCMFFSVKSKQCVDFLDLKKCRDKVKKEMRKKEHDPVD